MSEGQKVLIGKVLDLLLEVKALAELEKKPKKEA